MGNSKVYAKTRTMERQVLLVFGQCKKMTLPAPSVDTLDVAIIRAAAREQSSLTVEDDAITLQAYDADFVDWVG